MAVIGAGSWGTALALQFARAGCDVRLGGVVELDLLEAMVEERENKRYLPDVPFPPHLSVHPVLEDCLDGWLWQPKSLRDLVCSIAAQHGQQAALFLVGHCLYRLLENVHGKHAVLQAQPWTVGDLGYVDPFLR